MTKLCTIFGDTTATGSNAHPSNRTPSDTGNNEVDDNDDAISESFPKNNESNPDGNSTKIETNLLLLLTLEVEKDLTSHLL